MNSMETAKQVIGMLEKAGYEAYIVGGAVRDLLLGKEPSDVDVATSAFPEQVKKVFERTVDTGIAHGTVLVLIGQEGIEVTTFRTDGTYSDSRRPDSVEFVTSLEEDLRRRDFTINAMALTKEDELIDPFGGKEDLETGMIRAVGNPDERFKEDALRMLRAVRFTGQLGFEPAEETALSVKQNAPRIQAIAIERVKMELDKLFRSSYAQKGLSFLRNSGLADYLPSGHLFLTDWIGYPQINRSTMGWVYMLFHSGEDFTAVRHYRFSNDEKRLIEKTLEAAKISEWDSWVLYSYPLEALELAAVLCGRTLDILAAKQQLPLRSKSDMAVSGVDLLEWSNERRGPWLKEWLGKIEQRIIYGTLENDKERIREWFMDENSSDR